MNAGTPLGDVDNYDFVPLLGLGAEYDLAEKIALYANVSQSYRPIIFTQAVPTGGTQFVPKDLKESEAWQYEVGFRGNPRPWLAWDVSGFLLDFDDQIGTVSVPGGSSVENIGRAIHYGAEIFSELDLIGLIDAGHAPIYPAPTGKEAATPPLYAGLSEHFGSLSLYVSTTLLHAEFVSGPQEGKTPRYAPDYLVRAGLIYRWRDRFKLAFLGTFVGDSFADDNNTAQRAIPAYTVWDLTAEAKIYKDIVSLIAGVNNVLDEDYYARITDTGIDPAYARNFYAGFSLKF